MVLKWETRMQLESLLEAGQEIRHYAIQNKLVD
jgi:hypothetical protein